MPDFDVVESYHRSGRSADDEFDLPRFQPRTLPIASAQAAPSSTSRYLAGPPPASSSSSNMNSYYVPPPPSIQQNTYSPTTTTTTATTTSGGGGAGAGAGGATATTTTGIPQHSYQSQLQPQRQHSTRLAHILDPDISSSSTATPTTWASGLGRSASLSGMVRGARHGNSLPPDDVERAFGDLPSNIGAGVGVGGGRLMGPATMKQHSSPPSSSVQHTFYSPSISYQPPQDHRSSEQQQQQQQPSYSLRRSNTSVQSCQSLIFSGI